MRKRKSTPQQRRQSYEDFTLKWIGWDCKVKECVDGLVPYLDAGYSTVARCPVCHRFEAPGIALYGGVLTFRTDEEMAQREAERRELVRDDTYRRTRAREFFADLQKTLDAIGRSIAAAAAPPAPPAPLDQDPPDDLIPEVST